MGLIVFILMLYVCELVGNVSNVVFISGMIVLVLGVVVLLSVLWFGKFGDWIGFEKILIIVLIFFVLLLILMFYV